MSNQVAQSGAPVNLSATGTVSKASGNLLGFYVNSTSGGTLVLRQGAAGASSGTAFTGTITPAIGWHTYAVYCVDGLHATIAVGALDVTFSFAA